MHRAPFADTILRIAALLRDDRLRWAFTGSASFRLQGIDVPYNDIDIQTDAPSAYLVQHRLGGTVTLPVALSTSVPFRSHFGKTILDGWLVEIMGDVEKVQADGTWTAPPDLALLTRRVDLQGVPIPVLDLEYEADAYETLGRLERAALIRLHLGGADMIRLETARLEIRDHLESDLADLHRLLTDGRAMRYLPDIQCASLAQSEANLREALDQARRTDRTKYYLAIIEKDSGRYVGEIGVTIVEVGIGRLGYFINREFWGRGYVTEAVHAVLSLSFGVLSLHKVVTGCLTENAASERVMVKSGMHREAYLREQVRHEGVWKDRVEYAMLRTDWVALAQRRSTRKQER